MAKKAQNKAKEQTTVPEGAESLQETPAAEPESLQETPAAELESMRETVLTEPESPQETPAAKKETAELESADIASDILNNDVELADGIPRPEEKFNESPADAEQPQEEKILFYIRTVNARTAIRSAPEHPMRGNNIVGTIDDRELYGITEVADGFGRLAGKSGWINLDSSVVTRQE